MRLWNLLTASIGERGWREARCRKEWMKGGVKETNQFEGKKSKSEKKGVSSKVIPKVNHK